MSLNIDTRRLCILSQLTGLFFCSPSPSKDKHKPQGPGTWTFVPVPKNLLIGSPFRGSSFESNYLFGAIFLYSYDLGITL